MRVVVRRQSSWPLRLEHEEPAGRLLAVGDLGPVTVRIALRRPEDVDAEVLGLLARAYAENAEPPRPQRTARPRAPELGPPTVVIEASGLPGRTWSPPGGEHHNVRIALCAKSRGPAVHGRTGQALAGSGPRAR